MPATSGASAGEVLFSGSVQLTLTSDNGLNYNVAVMDNTDVTVARSTTRLTTQNVGSTRKKQHTVDFEYRVTFKGNMVGDGFGKLAVTIDGYLAAGQRPPRLNVTVTVPAQSVNSGLTVPGFTRGFSGGDLDTFNLNIPTAGALTNDVTIIFDTMT